MKRDTEAPMIVTNSLRDRVDALIARWRGRDSMRLDTDNADELEAALGVREAVSEPVLELGESCATVDGLCLNCGTKLTLWADEGRRQRLDDHCGNCGSRRVKSRSPADGSPQDAGR